jgi:hypothetical protein
MKITNVLCDACLLTGPLAAATKNKVGKSGKFLAFETRALKDHVYASNHHKFTTIYHPKTRVKTQKPL